MRRAAGDFAQCMIRKKIRQLNYFSIAGIKLMEEIEYIYIDIL